MKTPFALFSSLMLISAVHAGTFTVTNGNDAGAGSLREAIALAATSPGHDQVVFSPAAFPTGGTVNLAGDLTIPAAVDTDGLDLTTSVPGGNVNVAVNAGTLTFTKTTGWTGGGQILLGAASGTADAVIDLAGSNVTLSAPVLVRAGSSGVRSIQATHSTGFNIYGGNITLLAPVTMRKPNGFCELDFTGDINLGPHALTVGGMSSGPGQLYFSGRVFRDDPGAAPATMIIVESPGVTVRGSGDNTRLTIDARALNGRLILNKSSSASVHAVGGGLPPGTVALRCSMLGTAYGGDQIADTAAVEWDTWDPTGGSDSAYWLTGSETIGALNGGHFLDGGSLIVGAAGGSGDFGGTFGTPNYGGGVLNLSKIGYGIQTLSGSSYVYLRTFGETGFYNMAAPYRGTMTVSGGALNFTGNYSYGSGVTAESGGTVSGNGFLNSVRLQSGSFLAPGDARVTGQIGTLTVGGGLPAGPLFETPEPGTLTWSGGAVARFDLGTSGASDRVAVESQLIKAGAGTYQFDFLGTGVTGTTYTLFTFAASPGFSASDFSYTNLSPGLSGTFELKPGSLTFTTTGTARLNVVVTNTADAGHGSLRDALSNAAANAGPDTITFSPSLSGQVITLTSEIIISDTSGVALDATSLPARITIDGGPGTNRLFAVSPASPVSFYGFTFTGGGGSGGASGGKGGAILNNGGAITLAMCTFAGNSATGMGGAVANVNGGSITLSRCTLYGNSSATGGAISSFGSASLLLSQCTLSDNTATGGGALYSDSPLSVIQSTLTGNSATSGGAIYNDGALVLKNSIIAGNRATGSGIDVYNYAGTVTVSGANLIQFLEGAAADPSIISAPPLLAPLGNYGGTTKTMVLLPGSPARNAALGSVFSVDQRGFPITGPPDLGACEAGSAGNFAAWIWESLPGGASSAQHDASADFDGDGQNNLAEWLALTSPAASGDYFSASVAPSEAGVVITFRSAAGRSYRLRQSENLSSWTDAPNQQVLTGDGSVKSFTVEGAGGRHFYQVAASVSLEQQ